ncbi:hypothetical protein ABS71_16230 [bacterium SCN 62-11]|nr:Uma2 family endonuclease [Candidatus Eremiobacteraeota bacterium]ODT62098.1 MAG: hypothetical protein ABS71_16230 [bacterium SCN 62-11]
MADPALTSQGIPAPDVSHLITEDDTPLDNFFQDKQATLLTDALNASWPEGRPFVSAADVGIFATNYEPPVVPDVLLSTGVSFAEEIHDKDKRSYYLWLFGKPPEIVIEVVSNKIGGEDEEKLARYARIKVPYYLVFDPYQHLTNRPLRIRQLSGASYVDKIDHWFPEVGLGVCIWRGEYDGMQANWLRWCDRSGSPLLTGVERARQAEQRADTESARRRLLEEKLRELGVDPDSLT